MKTFKSDCFAATVDNTKEKPEIFCRALKKLDCENCSFYKNKKEVVNNVFYKDSFNNPEEYKEAVKAYKNRYHLTSLEDLEK